MTDELVAYIRARLDEDEQVARDAVGACWHIDYCDEEGRPFNDRFDPDRVLRGVEAKRELLTFALGQWDSAYGEPGIFLPGEWVDVLKYIAAEWSTHHDYRQEWAP